MLSALEEVGEAGTLLEADLIEESDPDDLPEQSQDQVGSSFRTQFSSQSPSPDCSPLIRSLASMLTRLQPILWAEARASVRFSCLRVERSDWGEL